MTTVPNAASEQPSARQHVGTGELRVAIIVDDIDPSRRRRCFWEEVLPHMEGIRFFELVSLIDKMESRQFFNVYAYDVIIFNWCVLDGAVMYASDRVQDIVCFFDDHFRQFVQKGGVLIMENQPKRWRPTQRAYEVLLPGEVKVLQTEAQVFGSRVNINPRFRSHPLLQHLPAAIHSSYKHGPAEIWFPEGSTSTRSLNELHPTKAYSGGFRRWRRDWLPVLYDEGSAFPVMLLKTENQGLWVVTTMYLASANLEDLVEALTCGFRKNYQSVLQYHQHQSRARTYHLAGAFAFVAFLAVGVYLMLAFHALSVDLPFGSTVLGDIVSSIVFALIVSSLTVSRRTIVRLVRGAFNR